MMKWCTFEGGAASFMTSYNSEETKKVMCDDKGLDKFFFIVPDAAVGKCDWE